jgi:ubiquitin-protein ligase
MQKLSRLKRELESITKNPPPGISCVQKGDSLDVLDASKCRTLTTTGYEYL